MSAVDTAAEPALGRDMNGCAGDLAKAAAAGTQEEEEVDMLVLTAVSEAFALKVCRK